MVKIPHGSGGEGWHKLQSAEKRRATSPLWRFQRGGVKLVSYRGSNLRNRRRRRRARATSNFSRGRNALPPPPFLRWKKNAISSRRKGGPSPPSLRSISPNVRCVSRTKGCAKEKCSQREIRITKMDEEQGWPRRT